MDESIRDARRVEPLHCIRVFGDYDLSTVDGILTAAARLQQSLPGYRPIAAHGSGLLNEGGGLEIEICNRGGHDFPAMLLACVCDHRFRTEAVGISGAQLELAIATMAPAEQCEAFEHPNISAWRRLADRLRREPASQPVLFFVFDECTRSTNVFIDRFMSAGAA